MLQWHLQGDGFALQFGRENVLIFVGLIALTYLFRSMHCAIIAIRAEKFVFYKIIGFRKPDFFLVVLQTFILPSIIISMFIGQVFNSLFLCEWLLAAFAYFVFHTSAVFALLYLLSKISRNQMKRKKLIRNSRKLFSNKYSSFAMKEISDAPRYPMLILWQIIAVAIIGFLIFIKLDYMIAAYVILLLNIPTICGSFEADGKSLLLYSILRMTRYDLFKRKLFAYFSVNLIILLLYTIFYIIFVGRFSMWTFVLLPVLLLNSFAQHVSFATLSCMMYPYRRFSNFRFLALLTVSAIPGASFVFYGYACRKYIRLRKESHLCLS
jgi:hypothetical protein